MRCFVLICVVALLPSPAVHGEPITIAEVPPSTRPSFEQDILPLFQRSCLACHSASEQQGGLVLESPQSLRDGGDSGPAIVPGHGNESLLLKLAAHQEESFMPPPDNDVNAPPLTSQELGILRLWIDQGARDSHMAAVPASPQVWQSLSGGLSPVYALALSSDGQRVAVTRANQLYIYDLLAGKLLATLEDSALKPRAAHLDLIQSLAWSGDGSTIASGGFREVKLWRKPHDQQLATLPLRATATALAVSPDRRLLATAAADNSIQLWEVETAKPTRLLTGHQGGIADLCFTLDGARLVSVAQDQTIRFWRCDDGTLAGVLEPPAEVRAIELVSNSDASEKQTHPAQVLVSGGVDRWLRTWTIPELPPRQLEHTAVLHRFAASDDARYLATSDHEGTVVIREVASSAPAKYSNASQWKLESGMPERLVLLTSNDGDGDRQTGTPGKLLVTESDGELSLWDFSQPQCVARWRGGPAEVTALAASADAAVLASGTGEGEIRLWNLSAGEKRLLPQSAAASVSHVAWNEPRTQFAVAGVEGDQPVIFVCDAESGKTLQTLKGHSAAVTHYAFSADGQQLVSGSEDRTVRVWKLDQPTESPTVLEGHSAPVSCVAFSPDGQRVLVGGSDHALLLWNIAAPMSSQKLAGHTGPIVGVGFQADQPFSASADRTVRFWNVVDETAARSFSVEAPPQVCAVSPRGELLALARDDRQISIHRLTDGALVHTFSHTEPVVSLSFSADGKKLVTTSAPTEQVGTATVWDLEASPPRNMESLVEPHLTTAAFTGKADRILTGNAEGQMAIRPLRGLRSLGEMEQPISVLKFTPDGQLLIAATKDGVLRGFALPGGEMKFTVNQSAPVHHLAISPSHQMFATAGEDATVRLWKFDGQPHDLPQISGLANACTQISFARDGSRIAVGTGGGKPMVHVYELASGLEQQRFSAHRQPVVGLTWASEGNEVISASADGIWQWEIHAAGQIAAHEDAITSLAAASNQPMQVFSGSSDGTVRRWDLNAGKQQTEYEHGGAVLDVDVHPGGQRLASVGDNHTAILWEVAGKRIAEMQGDILRRRRASQIEQEQSAVAQQLNLTQQRLATAEEILSKRREAESAAVEELSVANKELQDRRTALEQNHAEDPAAPAPEEPAGMDDAQEMLQAAEAEQKLAEQKQIAAVAAVKGSEEVVATVKKAVAEAEARLKAVQTRLETVRRQVNESERPVRSIGFSPDGQVLATAGDFPSIHTWDATTGAAMGAFNEQASSVHPIVFVDERRLVSASDKPEATVWNIDPEWRLERTIGAAERPDVISDRVTSLAFNVDGSQLLLGGGVPSRSGELSLFCVEDGSRIHHLPQAHRDTIYDAAYSPDGTQFISAGADKYVRLWSLASENPRRRFEGHTDYVLGVAWKSDAQSLVTASGDQTLKIWDIETGDQQRTISGFGKDITAVRYVGDSNHVLSSCGDGIVRLHDAANGRAIRSFAANVWLHCVDATADGKLVVAGSEDGRLFLWDGNDGKQLATITVGQ